MDQQHNSNLTETQEEAIASFQENQQNRYFTAKTAEMMAKDFLEANRMKSSSDPDEAARGARYEQTLLKRCGYEPTNREEQELKRVLNNRLENKKKILAEGGEQALLHSQEDIDRIHKALERLRTMGFGYCIDCGEEIQKERLRIYPEAERCAPCQSLYEKICN